MRYTATLEIIGKGRGIVTLLDRGEWSGSGLVEVQAHSAYARRMRRLGADPLYEAAFAQAEQRAAIKGGTLDRFSVVA